MACHIRKIHLFGVTVDLSKLDLNLLKTLLVLLQEKNTNRAELRLNSSQPAVSRTLAKIRKEFDDPLFIRQSRGLKLTPKAEELARTLPKIFDDLQSTLSGGDFRSCQFDRVNQNRHEWFYYRNPWLSNLRSYQ